MQLCFLKRNCESKKEHFETWKNIFSKIIFVLEVKIQILEFYNFNFHDDMECLRMKQEMDPRYINTK